MTTTSIRSSPSPPTPTQRKLGGHGPRPLRATPGRAALVALERARRWRLVLEAIAGAFVVGVVAASVGTAAVAVAALAGAEAGPVPGRS